MSKSKAMKFTSMAEMPPSFGKLKQIIILKLIEGTTPRKGAKAIRYYLIVTCIIDISHGQKGRRAEGQKERVERTVAEPRPTGLDGGNG